MNTFFNPADQHMFLAMHIMVPIASMFFLSLFADLFSFTKQYAQAHMPCNGKASFPNQRHSRIRRNRSVFDKLSEDCKQQKGNSAAQ